jgi:hypothetical protein
MSQPQNEQPRNATLVFDRKTMIYDRHNHRAWIEATTDSLVPVEQ